MKTRRMGKSGFLLLMCWLAYSMSYLGKVNYSANKGPIMDYFSVQADEAGLVGTFFFFAYGAGQIINGLFCKKYNLKWIIFSSLMTSAVINAVIPLLTSFTAIKWLWLLNGICLSVLWPSLVRLLSEKLPSNKMPKASNIMGTTVATGTLLIYGLSSLFSLINSFKLSFFVPAGVVGTIAILWLVFYNKFTDIPKEQESESLPLTEQNKKAHSKLPTYILIIICILAVSAVVTNLVKDGINEWVPIILKQQYGLPDYMSILLTLLIPGCAVFANFFAVFLQGKVKNFIFTEGILFVLSGAFVGAVTALLSTNLVAVTIACLIGAQFFASSSNSLITSIFPLYMKGKVNSGLIAGLLNGFCYVGSTLSAYGLGAIQTATNSWAWVFYVLLGASILVVLICLSYALVYTFKKKKIKDEEAE